MSVLDTIQGDDLPAKLDWINGCLFLLREQIPIEFRGSAWDNLMAAQDHIDEAAALLRRSL